MGTPQAELPRHLQSLLFVRLRRRPQRLRLHEENGRVAEDQSATVHQKTPNDQRREPPARVPQEAPRVGENPQVLRQGGPPEEEAVRSAALEVAECPPIRQLPRPRVPTAVRRLPQEAGGVEADQVGSRPRQVKSAAESQRVVAQTLEETQETDKELQWFEKELGKIEKEKQRLERERQKFLEREESLSKLRSSVVGGLKKEVLIHTPSGFYRFEGISRKFTQKLYEWEKAQGIGPESSTFALLNSSLAQEGKLYPKKKSTGTRPQLPKR
jgi:hypothetical protein